MEGPTSGQGQPLWRNAFEDLNDEKSSTMQKAGGREFNTEETINAKTLKWEWVGGFQESEQNGQSLVSEEPMVEVIRSDWVS